MRTRGAALDVTDRQAIEAQREELIRELEAKNTELEQFTYTVSHDLKSPLITMKGFLGLIARDVAEGRTERLREDVARMTSAADGMQHLLHELLRLSRIGRVVNPSERVPFGDVAREAAGLVRARLEERKVRLLIDDDLPVVYGDRVRLVEVAQNLLENAVKFLGDQPSPLVRVGVRPGERGASPVLFVQDNGMGIDPASTRRSSASSTSSTRVPRGAGWGSPSSGGSSRSTAAVPGSSRPAAARARPPASPSRCRRAG